MQPPSPPNHRHLAIHIGDHKAGSTSLQRLFTKGVTLDGHPVFMPGTMGNHSFAKALKDHDQGKGGSKQRRAISSVAKALNKSPARYRLISAEGLEGVRPDTLKAFIDSNLHDAADSLRIIAYVRPHAGRLLSNFAEQTKLGLFSGDLEGYFKRTLAGKRFVYLPRFQAWKATFGDQFILRPFLPDQWHNGTIAEDFIHHAFGTDTADIPPDLSTNTSLSLQDLMRLKVLQSHQKGHSIKLRHSLGWYFAHQIAQLPKPAKNDRITLHQSLIRDIQAAYQADAKALDHAFFDGQPLMQDALEAAMNAAVPEAQSMDPHDHFDAAELRSLTLLSELTSTLLGTPGLDWAKHLRQTRRKAQGVSNRGSANRDGR